MFDLLQIPIACTMPAGADEAAAPAYNIDQLAVCGAGGITKFGEGMLVGKPAQMDELAKSAAAGSAAGRMAGEKYSLELAMAEKLIELGRRHINKKQDEYPNLDRRETVPAEGRSQVLHELA